MELLAPAGSWDALVAAIQNGADAVYLGGTSFSARQYADNFKEQQIKEAVEYAHVREKKVYVTVNTLIDKDEFERALDYIRELYTLGADAIIVQDLGLLNAIRSVLPAMRVHASTQMTVHNSGGAAFLREQGIKRVVMAREMARDELKEICSQVKDMELEIFVHGALCYSYSGQCLFSSMVGGRSGNRGRCAQPCRLAYELWGKKGGLHKGSADSGRYILSPADLCLIENLGDLQDMGVHSLKIEGRMKRPEYVAVVTRAYREALDILASTPGSKPSPEVKSRLLKIFNRNFTSGHLYADNTHFLSSKRPNNRGVNIGRVLKQNQQLITLIKLNDKLRIGDGLEVWINKGKGPAFVVREMEVDGQSVAEAQSGEIISVKIPGWVGPGDRVFKTHDSELIYTAAASIKEDNQQIAVDVEAYLYEGERLKLVFVDERGQKGEAESRSLSISAEKHPLDEKSIREKVDKLGNTPFKMRSFSLYSSGNLIIPFSEINDTRRRACEELVSLRLKNFDRPVLHEKIYQENKKQFLSLSPLKTHVSKSIPRLSVAVGGLEEGYAAVEAGADRVYIYLESPGQKKYFNVEDIIQLAKRGGNHDCEVIPALPRIQKPGDRKYDKYLENFESVMVGNWGSLKSCLDCGIKVRADYSLNIFNPYTLRFLLEKGVKNACLSPELNFKQLQSFNNLDKVEMLVHGELILLVSEFCALAGIMGRGEGKCPNHCRRDNFFLKDEKGYSFPLATDARCRFYLFNSRTLCMIEDLMRFVSMGAEGIRIEGLRLSKGQVNGVVSTYREALNMIGAGWAPELAEYRNKLAAFSSSPFTKGHYYRGVL
ncbi:MAG: DUF3656 domain-containing protein [Syntrophomonas sp.]